MATIIDGKAIAAEIFAEVASELSKSGDAPVYLSANMPGAAEFKASFKDALELRKADVGYLVRETFESAMAMGRQAVLTLGAAEEEADAVMEHLRRRDAERMDLEAAGGLFAGRALVLGNQVKKHAAAGQSAETPA